MKLLEIKKKTRNDMKNLLYAINNKLGSAEENITEFEHITI